jgi:protein SCO1/2
MPASRATRLHFFTLVLWALAATAAVAFATLLLWREEKRSAQQFAGAHGRVGGAFTLLGADDKPFSSVRLSGKPYAIFFGFTRCGDVCPTTLSRLVKLRREAAENTALNIVFVTIDPANDGPKEVGQYAELFNAPIIGLTGSEQQINQIKKQFGIYAEPVPHASMGQQVAHTGTVLLFGSDGKFAGTISAHDADSEAIAKLKQLIALRVTTRLWTA